MRWGSVNALRRLACGTAALVGLCLVAACGPVVAPIEATNVMKPQPRVLPEDVPLPLGPESVYQLVNQGNLGDADDLLRDVWPVPRFASVTLKPLTWHEDPYGEKYWRVIFYSLRPTSNLLWAYYRTGDVRYRTKLLEILDSYLRFDDTGRTPDITGFDDPYAMAFRSMHLVNIYAKLSRSGDLPAEFDARLLDNIARLGSRLLAPENFQVDHNHGLSEALALVVLGRNLPQLDRDNLWREVGYDRLRAFFDRTVDADGVEVEKSPFYHFYVYKFSLQMLAWAQAFAVTLPPDLPARIQAMAHYSAYVIWPDGTVPMLGSSVRLKPVGDRATYAVASRDNRELMWALTSGALGLPPAQRAILFGQSGQAILRSPVDPTGSYVDNSQLLMDVGPPRTKHSHNEALAFNYYSHGRELIVDSGLDTYNAGQAYSYFHGASAHNTIVVDGKDQLAGPINAGRTIAGDGWAYQSGSSSVYPGVTHRRSVVLLARDLVLVADAVTADRFHAYEQLWHIFPGAHVVDDGSHTKVSDEHDNPVMDIRQAELPMTPQRYYGGLAPMQGWYSAEFGITQPIHVAGYRTEGTGAVFLTLITSGRYAGLGASVSGSIVDGDVAATVCAEGYRATVQIGRQAQPGETVTITGKAECPHAP